MELEEALNAVIAFFQAGQSVSYAVSAGAGMVLAFVAVIHLIQCFFGFKLFKLFTAIIGGIAGLFLGMLLAVIIHIPQLAVVFGPIMAVAGALVAFRVYQIGVFFYTGTIPALLWFALVEPRGAAILVLILFGALGIFLARPYIIAVTALPSGLIAGISIMIVFRVNNAPAGVFFGLILSVAGFLFQWYTTRNAPKPKNSWNRTAPASSAQSAAAEGQEMDRAVDWKALASAGLQTLEETVKSCDLPETLKHVGEDRFQFTLGQPKLPWLGAGVLFVLLGIGLDAALLSVLGLAAIVGSMLRRTSDSDQTNGEA